MRTKALYIEVTVPRAGLFMNLQKLSAFFLCSPIACPQKSHVVQFPSDNFNILCRTEIDWVDMTWKFERRLKASLSRDIFVRWWVQSPKTALHTYISTLIISMYLTTMYAPTYYVCIFPLFMHLPALIISLYVPSYYVCTYIPTLIVSISLFQSPKTALMHILTLIIILVTLPYYARAYLFLSLACTYLPMYAPTYSLLKLASALFSNVHVEPTFCRQMSN